MTMGTHACLLVICMMASSVSAKTYDMSDSNDCNHAGFIDINSDSSVTLKSQPNKFAPLTCSIDLRAENENSHLRVTFEKQDMENCNVKVIIRSTSDTLKTIDCQGGKVDPIDTDTRSIIVTVSRSGLDVESYDLVMTVTPYVEGLAHLLPSKGKDIGGTGGTTDKAGGLDTEIIIAIVAGVLMFLAIIAVIIVCCFRKKKNADDAKAMLKRREEEEQGFSNSGLKNGNSPKHVDNKLEFTAFDLPSSPKSGALLSDFGNNKFVYDVEKGGNGLRDNQGRDGGGYGRERSADGYNGQGRERSADGYNGQGRERSADGYGDGQGRRDRSVDEPLMNSNQRPILTDLKSNPRFRSYADDTDVDDRTQHDDDRYHGDGEESPSVAPPLPMAPKSPGVMRKKYASINRAPRPTSSTEEIQQLSIPLDERGDKNIQLIPESPNERGSLGDMVPIRLDNSNKPRNHSYLQQEDFDENIPDELSFDDEKPRHTLRPNRGRGDKKKHADISTQKSNESDANRDDNKRKDKNTDSNKKSKNDKSGFNDRRDKDNNKSDRSTDGRQRSKSTDVRESGRGQKSKSQKSPRLGSGRRRGGSLGRELDDDDQPERPDTPNSVYSNAPLQRSGSKQSLYASRNSLYNRRRRGSYSESIATFAQDDTSLYQRSNRGSRRYDDDDQQHFRRDRGNRSSRSMGDVRGSRRTNADYDPGESNFRRNRSNRSSRSYGDVRDTGTQTLYETATQTGSGYVNKPGSRKNSGRKSPRSKRSQSSSSPSTKGTKKAIPTEKPVTVDSGVGPDEKVKRAPRKEDTDSDDSVTKMKRKMALELNDAVKKPIPLKKPLPNMRQPQQHPFAENAQPVQPPSYNDSQLNRGYESGPQPVNQQPGNQTNRGYESGPVHQPVVTPANPYQDENIYDDYYTPESQSGYPDNRSGFQEPHQPPYQQNNQNPPSYQTTDRRPNYNPGNQQQPVQYPDEQIYQNLPLVDDQNPQTPKSPWEVLCELTDSDYKSHSKHSGSHISGHSGDRIDQRPQPYAKSEGSYGNRNYALSVGSNHPHSDNERRPVNPGNPGNPDISQQPKKSSWEQLEQMTQPAHKQQYGGYYDTAESNV